jgi:hypothetical protein
MCVKPKVWTTETVRSRVIEEGNCWIWQHGLNSAGYPMASIHGRVSLVGAWLYFHLNGGEPDRKHFITTKCRNKLCVSPLCLQRESRSDVNRRRKMNPAKKYAMYRDQSFKNGFAKIDMEKAREIRASSDHWTVIAEKYGLKQDAIYKIRANKSWIEQVANSSVFNWRPAA